MSKLARQTQHSLCRIHLLLPLAFFTLVFASASSVAAQGSPAPVTNLRIQRSGTSVILSWTHADAAVDHYGLWRSDSPYAVPGSVGMAKVIDVRPDSLNATVTHTDNPSAIVDAGLNVFYVARGVDTAGQPTALSNRVGEFDFDLVPAGSVGATGLAYYVAISGNDGDPGTLDRPFRTIQKCATVALAGDTCFIRAGTYRETVSPAHSGTEGKPITFVPYAAEEEYRVL